MSKIILLVEDSPFFRNLTVPMLAAVGYKVTSAENGQDAMKIIMEGHKFDAIITDIEMPVMDGFEFTAACRKNSQVNGTPIVGYTSSLSPDIIQRSKDVGMNDCIVKTDRPGLLEAVSHWMISHNKEAA